MNIQDLRIRKHNTRTISDNKTSRLQLRTIALGVSGVVDKRHFSARNQMRCVNRTMSRAYIVFAVLRSTYVHDRPSQNDWPLSFDLNRTRKLERGEGQRSRLRQVIAEIEGVPRRRVRFDISTALVSKGIQRARADWPDCPGKTQCATTHVGKSSS